MIIDIHCHIFPDRIALKTIPEISQKCDVPNWLLGTEDDLIRSMEENGVGYSVLQPVATNPLKQQSVNDYAYEVVCRHPNVLSFGSVHPDAPDWRQEIRRIRQLGFIGLKIHNDYQKFPFDSKPCYDLIDAAYSEGLMVLVHAGHDPISPDIHRSPVAAIKKALPLLRQGVFIAAHVGGHLQLSEAARELSGEDIYIDTGMAHIYYPAQEVRQALLQFRPDRILYGSDSPWDDQGRGAQVIRDMDFSQEMTEGILWKNASALIEKYGYAAPSAETCGPSDI